MSADNIIYIQQVKNKHRVWEQSASVPANFKFGEEGHDPTLRAFEDEKAAYDYAFDLQKEWQTEYGVCKLDPVEENEENEDTRPGILWEKTFEHEFVRDATFSRHEHEIYSLLFNLKGKDIECSRGSDNVYVFSQETMDPMIDKFEPLEIPEMLEIEKLADCYCYKSVEKDQVQYLWVPCSIFDKD